MLAAVVQNAGDEVLASALVGAAAALLVAVLGGLFTYFATTRKAKADLDAAKESARAMLEAGERQATAIIQAAAQQAAGTREAGLRNAIETEAMKLRFRMAERHLNRFHERAGALMALLTELQRSEEVAKRFVEAQPHVPSVALLEAELVARPEDWERLMDARLALHGAGIDIHCVLDKGNTDPQLWTVENHTGLVKGCGVAKAALQHITSVVNVSSVLRAQGTADPAGEESVATLHRQWEETKEGLKKMKLWDGRFVSEFGKE